MRDTGKGVMQRIVVNHKFHTSRNSRYDSVMIQSDEGSPEIFSEIRFNQKHTTNVWFRKVLCFIRF